MTAVLPFFKANSVEQDGGRHGRITESHTLYAHEGLLFIEFQGKKGLMCTDHDNLPASESAILGPSRPSSAFLGQLRLG
jgi:hypothetical protein